MPGVDNACSPSRNLLLASLSPEDYAAIRPMLEMVTLEPQHVLHNAGDTCQYVYFPRGGFLSAAILLQDGTMVEVAPIGREGLAGVPGKRASAAMANALVVVHGELECAYRMRLDDFRREMDKCGPFMDVVNSYEDAFLGVVMQNTGCNAAHSVEQRLAKWLLMAQDRIEAPRFNITQQFLATLLGATRPTVTGAASALQRKGLIDYSRGQLQIVDRPGLEKSSCECYQVSRRLLSQAVLTPAAPGQSRNR
jgi:CRP-like cAMP-binding protein